VKFRSKPTRSVALAVMALLTGSILLAGCTHDANSSKGTSTNLTPAVSVTIPHNNFPASRDNDAGVHRIPDTTPDNDADPNPSS
jgi:hypothetical protein